MGGKMTRLMLTALLPGWLAVFLWAASPAVRAEGEAPGDSGPRITLELRDAEIQDVLRLFARLGNVNIVVDQGVVGKVSFILKDVPFEEALDLVLKARGFVYTRRGDSLVVTTPERLKSTFGDFSTEVVYLRWAAADQVKKALTSVIPGDSIQVESRTNALVLKAQPEELLQVRELLRQIDVPTRQVLIEVRVEEVSSDSVNELGIRWPTDWTASSVDKFLAEGYPALSPDLPLKLRLLEESGKATLLANPRVAVVDNQEAKIHIGERIPVEVTEIQEGVEVTRLDFVDAGILLKVTPHLNGDDYITAVVNPEVSTITGWTEKGFPKIRTREVSSILRMRDGQTVVIGGLLQEEEVLSATGVPYLSRLPLLGNLFKVNTKSKKKGELLIFLTARVVREGENEAEGEGAK
ncbi:MAG: secretin N-terminal domain-containing protein [Bacillota bacterium]|nr:secretin N-terminal domain-containing protein [Bacillota bacterium]